MERSSAGSKTTKRRTRAPSSAGEESVSACGLCGKKRRLTTTECCRNPIRDDEDKYVLFSYARSSCYRHHRRFTLCGFHQAEGHRGDWKGCDACRRSFETEMYVYCGTNEYNFEILANPPAYEPTKCAGCGSVLNLGEGGYSIFGGEYRCEPCADAEWEKRQSADKRSKLSSPPESPGAIATPSSPKKSRQRAARPARTGSPH
jgi:hypothetical protein